MEYKAEMIERIISIEDDIRKISNQNPHPSNPNARKSLLQTSSIPRLKFILQKKTEQLLDVLAETLASS